MSQIAASTLQRHMVPPWFYSLIAGVIALLLSMQLSCFWITCHKCYSLATFRPRQLNCLRLTCHRDRGLHASTLLWLCSWATSTYFPNFVVHFGTHVQWTFTITSTTSPIGATVYYAWRTIHYCCLYLKDAAAKCRQQMPVGYIFLGALIMYCWFTVQCTVVEPMDKFFLPFYVYVRVHKGSPKSGWIYNYIGHLCIPISLKNMYRR